MGFILRTLLLYPKCIVAIALILGLILTLTLSGNAIPILEDSGANSRSLSLVSSSAVSGHLLAGGDPLDVADELGGNRAAWIISWMIHLIAWLLIPAVIAVVVAKEFAKLESQRLDNDLDAALRRTGARRGLSDHRLEQFVEQAKELLEENED